MAEASGVTAASLKIKITELLQATHVEIEDMSGLPHYPSSSILLLILTLCSGGCGQAFSAVIVSPQFEKKTTLARHRLVNNALKAEIAAIHAWTPKMLYAGAVGEAEAGGKSSSLLRGGIQRGRWLLELRLEG